MIDESKAKARAILESRKRLEAWIERTLDEAPAMGQGRNNWMVMLTPRMLEVGEDKDSIFDKFKWAFDLEDDDSKDDEIRRAIDSGEKYKTEIRAETNSEHAERKAKEQAQYCTMVRLRDTIQAKHPWSEEEIVEDGGIQDWTPREQTLGFLQNLWSPQDILWVGRVQDSGKPINRHNFRTAVEWQGVHVPLPWQWCSHATFVPGALSRGSAYMHEHRFMVVESDILGRNEMGAVFQWLRVKGLTLRMVVFSGNHSLHGWFDWPVNEDIKELRIMLHGLQCDPSTTRSSQPVRLPGHMRENGNLQRLLYLR